VGVEVEAVELLDVLGFEEGVTVALGLTVVLGDEVSDGEGELVSEGIRLADVAAVVPAGFLAWASTIFFGTSAQFALEDVPATVAATLAFAPRASPNVPTATKANTASAPSAAGLMISGLTRATLAPIAVWQNRPCCPGYLPYSWQGPMLMGGSLSTPKVHVSVARFRCCQAALGGSGLSRLHRLCPISDVLMRRAEVRPASAVLIVRPR
jgi:hypothetical protein